jgi:hypothetical protein
VRDDNHASLRQAQLRRAAGNASMAAGDNRRQQDITES